MKLMTINEAAGVVNRSEQQLRRGVSEGRYPFIEIGARKLLDVDELAEIIQAEDSTINIRQAAELTGLSEKTIRRGCREGWIPHRKGKKAYEFIPGALLAALEGMKRRKN